ncbi:MAG: hypothetical protein ACREUL_10440 [Steroidobacteraceae bacterium]
MRKTAMSRRALVGAGACALAATASIPQIAGARAEAGLSRKNEETVRKYYQRWERKGEQVEAVECYFGGQNSYPSAVAGQK